MFFFFERSKASIIAVFVTLGLAIFYELIQIWAKGIVSYLSETVNYLDILGYLSGVFYTIDYMKEFQNAMTSLKDSQTEIEELERAADLLATAELREKTL